ncbi:MFS transporter [Dactylosporangium sp. CA-139066]|uniref:MFS transporter n=1 Tax=Dactylosporangium sp. CA-139066 TaxID=3239930 RepID=UPI003D94E3AD
MNRAVRWLFLGDAVSAAGIGLTQPYLVILLHGAKGLPLATAAAMTSLLALASVPGNWLSGAVADRFGGHRAMTAGLLASAGGLALVAAARDPVALGCAVALVGFGWSVTLPAYSALLAAAVPEPDQGRTFTLQFALFNAGMGAGAAFGAGAARSWWVAAATCLVAVACVRASGARPRPAPADAGGYRALLGDRALRRLLVVAGLASAAGYGVYNAGLPILAVLGGDPAGMSWASVANCLVIVAGLPLALRLGRRLRPAGLIAAAAGVWAAGWGLCAVQAALHPLPGRFALVAAAVLMGAGELLLSGALPAMVNALAPEALRGRYNAALTLAMTAGMWAGPLLAAGATAAGASWLLFALAVTLLAVVVALVRPQSSRAASGTAGSARRSRSTARPA